VTHWRALVAALAFLVGVLAPTAAVLAQDEAPEDEVVQSIGGRLTERADGDRTPIPGVTVIVSFEGSEVDRGVSDEDGEWLVPVPEPGTYTVAIDEDTLPDGVGLADPERAELTVDVTLGQSRRVAFQLGEGRRTPTTQWTRVASLFVVGLKLGAIIALSSIGLSLVFGVTGLVNFAHAEAVTIGAFVAYVLHAAGPQWPLVVAAIPAILFGGLFGLAQEKAIWHPLRRRGMSLLSMMVVSIGLGLALRFLILVINGGLPRAYPDWAGQGAVQMLGIPIVPKHLATIAVALVLLAGVGLFLNRTQAGTSLRAVRDNPDLSESSGIDVQRVIALTWVVGGLLAAAGGVFFGLTESLQWDMGFKLLLLMFSAVILGGIGTAYGTMLGSFVVGVTVEMSVLVVPTELKNAVGLFILIVMLLVRPQGLLGVRERIG
jgi:neutral amino acid transport system permease protein